MKTIFLTSSMCGYVKTDKGNEIVKVDNSNGFIDRLKEASQKLCNFVFVASDPDNRKRTEEYANIIIDALNLDGFAIENVSIIDHSFKGNIKKTIIKADCVCLMGGNVPMQNAYFKEIKLEKILKDYNGIIIGQSAGSMNCSKIVYTQPEWFEEFENKSYKRLLSGLGLINFTIMPHMNSANEIDSYNHPSVMQMCLEDSYKIPHYGIVDYGFIEVKNGNAFAYGETYKIENGKCILICKNGEKYNLSDFEKTYNINKN